MGIYWASLWLFEDSGSEYHAFFDSDLPSYVEDARSSPDRFAKNERQMKTQWRIYQKLLK